MNKALTLLLVMVTISLAWAQQEVIEATDLETLRAKAGTDVIVEGQVTEIGSTKDGSITFINVGLPKKQGFVAVIFRGDYPAFGDGFDTYRSQKIRVSGALKLYRGETPQIEVKSPDQITIVTE